MATSRGDSRQRKQVCCASSQQATKPRFHNEPRNVQLLLPTKHLWGSRYCRRRSLLDLLRTPSVEHPHHMPATPLQKSRGRQAVPCSRVLAEVAEHRLGRPRPRLRLRPKQVVEAVATWNRSLSRRLVETVRFRLCKSWSASTSASRHHALNTNAFSINRSIDMFYLYSIDPFRPIDPSTCFIDPSTRYVQYGFIHVSIV